MYLLNTENIFTDNLLHIKSQYDTSDQYTLVNSKRSPHAARIKPRAMKSSKIPENIPEGVLSNIVMAIIIPLQLKKVQVRM